MIAIEFDEQVWTYNELFSNAIRVVHNLKIDQGEVVYQYVDRSLEMVCGLLGIMCAGGIYCPLSPTDPPMRIRLLIEDIQGRCVLVHGSTHVKFINIDSQHIRCVDLGHIFSIDMGKDVIEKGNFIVLN